MNYEWLFSFVAFAERRNFTKAAMDLHISQPALHVQIKKLGAELGVVLYTRAGRALVLTAEGEKLAAYGRSVQEQGREVRATLRGEVVQGPLILASGQGAFLYLLSDALRRFPKQKWPLRLLTMNSVDAVQALRDARVHAAVTVLDRPTDEFRCALLRSVGQLAILPNTHPLASRKRLRPSDLAGESLVVAPEGQPHRRMLEQSLRTDGVELQVGVEATGWELMLAFARMGMGIAVVNDFCPVPRSCVGVPLGRVPESHYYLVERSSNNPARERLRKLLLPS